ncbi:hypothetical protein RB201_01550 [Streptomyces sp. S1A(2023)]
MTRRTRIHPEFGLRPRKQIRHWGPVILAALLLCWMAGAGARETVEAPVLVMLAFSAGAARALWGISCLREGVWLGPASHDMLALRAAGSGSWREARRRPSSVV